MKITANEFRLSNLMLFEGIVIRFEEIMQGSMSFDTELQDRIQLIPLSEKWFLNFGFEKKWDDFNGGVEQYEKGILTWLSGNFRIGSYWVNDFEIKYVHQLQNLFYCLTGTELELQEFF